MPIKNYFFYAKWFKFFRQLNIPRPAVCDNKGFLMRVFRKRKRTNKMYIRWNITAHIARIFVWEMRMICFFFFFLSFVILYDVKGRSKTLSLSLCLSDSHCLWVCILHNVVRNSLKQKQGRSARLSEAQVRLPPFIYPSHSFQRIITYKKKLQIFSAIHLEVNDGCDWDGKRKKTEARKSKRNTLA